MTSTRPATEETTAPPEMALKFTKMSGFATTHGQDFEVNMAALLFLRGLNSDLDFQLGTNVKGAGAMDDLVFRFKRHQDTCWTTLYVQLKYKETLKVGKKELKSTDGAFSVKKYFKSYGKIRESMSGTERETLFDGSFEQCMFVIFTNAKAKDALGDGRCEDLSLAEEFLWTDSGSVYSFEGDDDMLQCLGESGDDGRKFLSRLRLFCDQPRVARLKAAVRDELYKVTEETVRGVDVARLCDAFLVNVKAWWEKSNYILHRGHDLLRRAVEQIRLESSCQKTLIEFTLDVEFKDQALSSLRQSLASDVKVFLLESSENSFRLSLTKLLQAIGGQILVLDSQGLLANRRALLAQWRSGDSRSLVICTEDWRSGNAEECCQAVRDICQIREASSLWNVVFCTGKTEVSEGIHKSFPECKSITGEHFLLSQLANESRESVLAKKIAFQGCDVSLRQILCLPDENVDVDLDAYLDAPSVEQVLSSRGGLSVGSALAPGVDFYVDRSLGRATVVKPSLFHEDALRETVTVRVMRCEAGLAARAVGKTLMDSDSNDKNGLVEKAILYLSSQDFRSMDLKNEEVIQNLNQSRLILDKSGVFIGPKFSLGLFECNSVGLRFGQKDTVTALRVRTSKLVRKEACFLFVSDKTNEQDVRKLSDFVQSKHLLSLENGQLRWLESHGDMESIRPHIDQDQVVRFAPETAMDVEDRLVLVCAEPGMGKSTLMTRLAQNTKAKHPHCFVVLLALNDQTQLFAEDRHKDVLDFLSRASKIESPLQKALLKFALKVSGKVVVLLDGFDEIAPRYVDQSLYLLSRLNKESKASKIWMTSRNSIKLTLENHIAIFSGKLFEFCEDDQRSFLSKFWADESTISKTELKQVIDSLLSSISQSIKDERTNFLGVPLQTRMLAEVCEALVTGSGDKSTLPDKLDLLGLLEKFVEKKFWIFVQAKLKIPSHDTDFADRYEELKNIYINRHMKAGLILILDNDDITRLGMEWVIQESLEFFENMLFAKDKMGFIDGIVNGKPRFVHRVYAEFFVAKWISEHLQDNRELIASKMFTGDFAVVRNIFDRIHCRDSALHTAVLDEDLEAVRTLLRREDVDVQAQDGGGRTALHLAASRGTSEDREENKRRGEILDLLIGKTSDLDQIDNVLGGSPLSYAEVTQSWNAIDKLLRCTINKVQFQLTSADLKNQGMLNSIFDQDLDTLLCSCLEESLDDEQCFEDEIELFHRASKNGCLKIVSLLLNMNANSNKCSKRKNTQPNLNDSNKNTRLQAVKRFLKKLVTKHKVDTRHDAGTFINMEDKDGNTAIYFAAKKGYADCIRFLISQGGYPVSRNHDNSTPLHSAAFNKHPGAVRVLLEAVDDEDRAAAVNSYDNDGDSVLMCGAWGGCVECVGLLVQAGGKLTRARDDGWTPLMAAAQKGHLEVVRYMLHNFVQEKEGPSKKEYVNMFAKSGNTAIHIAALNGKSDCIRFLIDQGGDPQSCSHDNCTPLNSATLKKHPGAVKVLLEAVDDEDRAAAVNSCDKNGNSMLMRGVWGGCVECVGLLVQAGGKLTQVNDDGFTPLIAATQEGHLEVVSYLLHNFNKDSEGISKKEYVNMFTKVGNTAIHHAAIIGQSDCISFLISQGGDPLSRNQDNSNPLHLAAFNKHPGAVRVLLEAVDDEDRAAAVNSRDNDGDSVLMCGAWGGCVECVGLLVQAGGKLTQARDDGWTPLMAAAQKGHLKVVSYLLHNISLEKDGMSKKDYVNMFTKVGNTAIHFGARHGQSDCIRFLIDHGGDPRSRSCYDWTPLHSAAFKKHPGAVRVLLEAVDDEDRAAAVNSCDKYGYSVLLRGALGGCVECVGLLVQAGAKLTQTNDDGWTPLMAAAREGHLEVVSYLLHNFVQEKEGPSKKEYVNMFIKDGNTAIHIAAINGQSDCIRFLISQGEDPRSRNHDNSTPLHLAAYNKHPGAVRVLLEAVDDEDRAAAVNSCDNDGDSVLMCGACGGCVECVGLLVQAGGKLTQAKDDGWTPLMAAAHEGHQEVVNDLLHNFNADKEGMSRLDFINMRGSLGARHSGNTAIHLAARNGHTDVLNLLIKQGGDPRSQNNHNSTPLHLAAELKHPGAVRVSLEAVDDEDRAAAVNSCDNDGDSVLMCGALGGCVECVGLLVQAGGKLTQVNINLRTPLMAAADENHSPVVSYLLRAFDQERDGTSLLAFINMRDKDGNTAIDLATAECRLAIEDALSDAMGQVTCGLWRRGVHGFPCLFGANRSLVRTSCHRFAYFKLPAKTG